MPFAFVYIFKNDLDLFLQVTSDACISENFPVIMFNLSRPCMIYFLRLVFYLLLYFPSLSCTLIYTGGIVNNTLRPTIPSYCDLEWRTLMEQCWAPNPAVRPSFTEIARRLRVMSAAAAQTKGQGHKASK